MSINHETDRGNPLLEDFIYNTDRVIHKWLSYFDVYHRVFNKFRGRPIKFIEIGVQNGGSTKMWSRYFGSSAQIIGIDIDPACKSLEKEGYEIWIGDQADPGFWKGFKEVHPSFDIVLDDGGHTMGQQITSFNELFPALVDGGIYLCEDTHTSYFETHGGGLNKPGTFHEYVKSMIDSMHAWYYVPLGSIESEYLANYLYAISVYDSMVVLEKKKKNPPLTFPRGYGGHLRLPTLDLAAIRHIHGIPD